MKKIVLVCAAFTLFAATEQALACDWGLHAHNTAATIVACDANSCAALPPTQEAAAPESTDKTADRTADQSADQATSPAPTTVAEK
jgi:hypothetical protein